MALFEQQNFNGESDHSDGYDSDDSQNDPTFDILEETRSSFSGFSMKKESNLGLDKEMTEDSEGEGDLDVLEVVVPELDEKDQKSYETISKVIQARQLENLKVEQCKIYLRKHGLRLTGNKDTLVQRIREHLDIINDGGEKKYPASSFLVNCKGDACTGDIVLFEQNVYEMFNIASRSASGPPCGTRLVAGRIVKESYGAAKQQHTFTIEVLWSKGEKPLPPLHPLLIKGRNLYRLTTMRQMWEDEEQRKKILLEKHARGCVARSSREVRVLEREMRKLLKSDRARVLKKEHTCRKKEEDRKQLPSSPSIPLNNMVQTEEQPKDMQNTKKSQTFKPKQCWKLGNLEDKVSAMPEVPEYVQTRPKFSVDANVPSQMHILPRQPLASMNYNLLRYPFGMNTYGDPDKLKSSMISEHRLPYSETHSNSYTIRNHLRTPGGSEVGMSIPFGSPTRSHAYAQEKKFYGGSCNMNTLSRPKQMHGHVQGKNFNASRNIVQGHVREKQQLCRYYPQGRCYYGYDCKYLHEG